MSAAMLSVVIDPLMVEAIKGSAYQDVFKAPVAGRSKRRLGNALGLKNFGVNLTTLKPGAHSALRHWHTRQDEVDYPDDDLAARATPEGRFFTRKDGTRY